MGDNKIPHYQKPNAPEPSNPENFSPAGRFGPYGERFPLSSTGNEGETLRLNGDPSTLNMFFYVPETTSTNHALIIRCQL